MTLTPDRLQLRYLDDDEALRRIVAQHLGPTGIVRAAVSDRTALINDLVDYCATLRPAPKTPKPKPYSGVPVLHGDDIFRITGRGTVVVLQLAHQPVSDVSIGDLVMFDEGTKTCFSAQQSHPESPPAIDPSVVYEVRGIETTGRNDGNRGLLIKPVARPA